MSNNETNLMKDRLGLKAVEKISFNLQKIYPKFNGDKFIIDAMKGLSALELKARVNHLIEILHQYLPEDFDKTAKILIRLAKQWQNNRKLDGFAGFGIWPIIDYVGVYGLDHPNQSLDVLEVLTPLFSAEFAIRPFINAHYAITHARFLKWVEHESDDVRRLISEGTRPKLPWGLQLKQFIKDPSDVIELLDLLKNDDAEYVRRSVANNLNDISKDHPQLVVDTCKAWLKKSTKAKYANQMWIAKRATRGLIKQGYSPAFALLGYTDELDIEVKNLNIKNVEIKMGDHLEFEFDLISNKSQKFVLDYAIYFMKSNGKLAPKIFKLKNMDVGSAKTINIRKKQMFKLISTRKYYSGEHKLEIILNGARYAMHDFMLEM
ncbi:MAG: DNA alkylation repair protein [Rhizobiales bacterium]|nr:DNA alkylation repair protein [Hyphomicrobiales bacterium]